MEISVNCSTKSVMKCYTRCRETNGYYRACLIDITCRRMTSFTARSLPQIALREGYRRAVNHTLNLLEPSPPVCRGVHLNRNDSRASERWNRKREREKEGKWGFDWHRNAKYHCPLYIQEHNLTKLLAYSDLLPPRGTGSFLIHVSNDVTLRPLVLLLLAPFNRTNLGVHDSALDSPYFL